MTRSALIASIWSCLFLAVTATAQIPAGSAGATSMKAAGLASRESPHGAQAAGTRGASAPKMISYYGRRLAGRKTASGERYDPAALTMAHRTLPFGTRVRVTNIRNGRSVILRVNDRGPHKRGRAADVSLAAARKLKMIKPGVIRARLEVVSRPRASQKRARAAKPAHGKRAPVKHAHGEQSHDSLMHDTQTRGKQGAWLSEK